jgi:hypothetical protein
MLRITYSSAARQHQSHEECRLLGCSSETSVHIRSTRRHIPEDGILHSHRRENLDSYTVYIIFLLWLYSPLLGLGRFFSFLLPYTVGRTPWKGDQPIARPLPTHRTKSHRHPYLEWDSNPRSQRSSERRQFMP